MTIRFAINHMVAPRRSLLDLFVMAHSLGLQDVEIRNDLAGTAIIDGTDAETVRADAGGLNIVSINALQRFNDWNATRAREAVHLIDYARICGAEALVLCPVNDVGFRPGDADRLAGLRIALTDLAPQLREAGLIGLVEPLGFAECSLRSKREAIEAIDAVGASDVFKLVHDTFHHYIADEPAIFPEWTGLVHISGVSEPTVPAFLMRDPHRVLVDEADRVDNIGQIQALIDGGYAGLFSFEPFADSVAELVDAASVIKASMAFIERNVRGKAACTQSKRPAFRPPKPTRPSSGQDLERKP